MMCTAVLTLPGFGLMGHAYEMASGSGMTIHLDMNNMPYHKEAIEMAKQGFIPAGAYRNRDYTDGHCTYRRAD